MTIQAAPPPRRSPRLRERMRGRAAGEDGRRLNTVPGRAAAGEAAVEAAEAAGEVAARAGEVAARGELGAGVEGAAGESSPGETPDETHA